MIITATDEKRVWIHSDKENRAEVRCRKKFPATVWQREDKGEGADLVD